MCAPPRHRKGSLWGVKLALILMGLFASARGYSGPWLSLETQFDASVAVVRVAVDFRKNDIVILDWITGHTTDEIDTGMWTGLCLPDEDLTQHWVTGQPNHPGAPVWAGALENLGYNSVAFLREKNGVLMPYCEAEAMLARAWDLHPEYDTYLKSLAILILDRLEGPNEFQAPPATILSRDPSPLVPNPDPECFAN